MKAKLFLILILIFLPLMISLAADETFTITTYYPSPYGSYNELSTNYLNYGTGLASPPIYGAACAKEGQTAYNPTDNKVYLCDGSIWTAIDSEISFTYFCYYAILGYGSPTCSDAGGAQRYCPAGFQQKRDLGEWGYCQSGGPVVGCGGLPPTDIGYYIPPGAVSGCSDPLYQGRAYVCSQ